MGRDDKNEQRGEHWTKLTRPMMQTLAWRALSTTAQALYPWLKLEWRGPRANNNGQISLSVRQAANVMGISKDTAAKAFQELQAKGFIVCLKQAETGVAGIARCPEYEITEIAMPTANVNQGRRLYKDWRPGHDFEVVKTNARNPAKTKSRHKNSDSTVPKLRTVK